MYYQRFIKNISKFIVATSLIGIAASCSDNSFTISGEIENASDKSIVLERGINGRWLALDSTRTSDNGEFSINFEAPSAPEIYRIRLDENVIYFPIDSIETINLTSSLTEFGKNYTLSGSDQAVKMMNFDLEANKLANNSDSATLATFKRKVFNEIIKDSQASILSYYVLNKTINGKYLFDPTNAFDIRIYAAVATAYKQFKPNDPHTAMLEEIAILAMRKKNLDEGRQRIVEAEEISLIDIELKDVDGKICKLSDFTNQGKQTILIFSLLTDENSPNINREIAKIYEANKNHLNIYQVCLDYDQLAWKKAAVNLPWTVVYDPNGNNSRYVTEYNVQSLPAAYIYNSKGELSAQATDFSDLTNKIKQAL